MSKTLYEEALADARKLKEVAERNAKHALEEAVLPQIRSLIEKQLFEDLEEKDDEDGEVLLDDLAGDAHSVSSSAVSPPDEEGKVTLDLDALHGPGETASPVDAASLGQPLEGEDELELNAEALMNMFGSDSKLEEAMARIEKEVSLVSSASKLIRETRGYHDKIEELIESIQHTYQYVQERLEGSSNKADLEERLEGFFKEMNRLKETKMKNVKDLVNEGDLTIKLTGVPDDLDVEDLGIDLITGEEEEGEAMGGDDMGDLEAAPADDEGGEDADLSDMGDDEVVEISESMLKSEIKRMRDARLKREAVAPNNAKGGSIPVDDFGGGSDEGDPWLDGDVTTADNEKAQAGLQESDAFSADGLDEMDESDMVGPGASQNQDQGHTAAGQANDQKNEVARLKAQLQNEVNSYKVAAFNYQSLVSEAKKATDGKKKASRAALAKKEAEKAKKAKKRVSEIRQKIKEASTKLQNEGRVNRGPAPVAEDRDQVASLRNKLNESNLFNARLFAANKLLQNESLTAKQKASAIERLDEAKTIREVKLVYESIAKALSSRRSLAEGAGKVVGSSSRTTAPGATLTEAVEGNRWVTLAGIK